MRLSRQSRLAIVLLSLLFALAIANQSEASPSIALPKVSSGSIRVAQPTNLTITTHITASATDPPLVASSVNLLRVDATGSVTGILGVMQDDGSGTSTFTITLSVTETNAGTLGVRVSAAFRGVLKRVLSPIATVVVTATPASASFISPSSGPTGTLVVLNGSGFLPTDRLGFGGVVTVPTTFLDDQHLSALIPFEASDPLTPLAAGGVAILLNGVAVGNFTVTELPANPYGAGEILGSVISDAVREFDGEHDAVVTALSALQSAAADQNAQSFLIALQQLLPEIAAFVDGDLTRIPNNLDPFTLAMVERILFAHGFVPSSVQATSLHTVTTTASGLSGDAWLENRRPFVDEINRFRWLAKAFDLVGQAPFGGGAKCVVEGFLSALGEATGTALDIALGNYGIVRRLQVSDDEAFPNTLPPNRVVIDSEDTAQLYAAISVSQVVGHVPANDNIAIGFVKSCLTDFFVNLLPPGVAQFADEVIKFYEVADSTGFGTQGRTLPLGNNQGPLEISFDKLSSPDWLGDSPFLLGPCLLLSAAGEATACTVTGAMLSGSPNLVESWHFGIKDAWIDIGAERPSADVEDSFEIDPRPSTVSITKSGSGTGAIASVPTGIDCGPGCQMQDGEFKFNSDVTLTALAAQGSQFIGWGGDCSGTGASVQLTLDTDKNCTATFDVVFQLMKTGTGDGRVVSAPAGIDCGVGCASQAAPFSGVVQLTASRGQGSVFIGWGGDCSGADTQISIDVANVKGCSAKFDLGGILTANKSGAGTGTISSVPAGLNCGTGCSTQSAPFSSASQVQLTATSDQGSTFVGWSGACAGTTAVISITVSADETCTATFSQALPAVRVNPFGSQNLSAGPFQVQAISVQNGQVTPVAAPADITVTLRREVISQCNGLLFSSNRSVTISQGQLTGGALDAAGRDPSCNTLPITTRWTVLGAVMAPNINLSETAVPPAQLQVSIVR